MPIRSAIRPPAQVQQLLNAESSNSESSATESRFLDVERDIKLEYLKTLRQNNQERKKYAMYIFILTCIWAFLIFLILFFEGFGANAPFCFSISDNVLITLITTTTINFFGFFLLVIKYLFNSEKAAINGTT